MTYFVEESVLEGRVRIESTDVWGNTNLIGSGKPGSVFAETYAAVRDDIDHERRVATGAIRTHRHREVSDCLAQFGA